MSFASEFAEGVIEFAEGVMIKSRLSSHLIEPLSDLSFVQRQLF